MFEYKITYRRLGDMLTNCHYYMASDASEALEYQLEMIDHKGWKIEILKMSTKGFELGTSGSKGQSSSTEIKFLGEGEATNF